MSFAKRAAKSGLWFASFKFIAQIFSWAITIIVARILVPEDYGLMAMASILTGYVVIFSELGLGTAIIQKKEISQKELSSIFWFSMGVGGLFAVVSFGLSYPTAWIFNEPRVIPITQLISVIFIIGALMIVPYSLLSKEVRFKEIGMIQLTAVVVSSLLMLWMARRGYGVWTLINGTIIQRFVMVVLVYIASKWWPTFYFQYAEAKSLLEFGLKIAGSRSLFYIFQKADKFIVGKMFNALILGYYSFAMQLASIPTEKIVSIIQQVSFPVFSRYQDDISRCRDMYMKTTKYIAIIVTPLFLGGAFFGEKIILTLLGTKWIPIIFVFRMLCIAQLIIAVTVVNNVVHNSQGRPHWTLLFNLSNTILMPLSIFVAARYGFNALAIPWVSVYPLVCLGWTWITLKKLNIQMTTYAKGIIAPLLATIIMIAGIWSAQPVLNGLSFINGNIKVILAGDIVIGAIFYFTYLLVFEKKTLIEIWSLRKI